MTAFTKTNKIHTPFWKPESTWTGSIEINFVTLIAKKRDRIELSRKEIRDIIAAYTEERIPDYQMSAFAMAVVLNGMTFDETVALTEAMLQSGEQLAWEPGRPVVDKHSTGGIGDKVSIPLAPMLACCNVRVPMISGRGLGPTGGTLDKLESIAGFRTDLSADQIRRQIQKIGCIITGATPEIAPADRRLYALRDVTATVESIPLITASILSKKLAAGLDALILDVKFGSGAFMQTLQQATELAKTLVAVANELGVATTAILTDMNQMLGRTAGNAVEIAESLDFLRGDSADDLRQVTIELGAHLLTLVNSHAVDENRNQLQQTIKSGSAFHKFQEMVAEQGGTALEYEPQVLNVVTARQRGFLHFIDARKIGLAIIELGGGRKKLGDELDREVGVRQLARIGDPLQPGEPVYEVLGGEPLPERLDAATGLLRQSFRVESQPVTPPPLIQDVITG